jgi:hypothetical protein
MPTVREVMDYIIKSAQSRGIDPNIALRVFNQESGFNPAATNITPREKSYGVTQLNTQGGLGVEAQKRGIDPTDPSQWMKHVDFSLDTVLRDGWRQWMGAKDTGVGRWQGVNAMANPPRPPGNIPVASGGNRTALIIHHSGGRGDHHGVINTLNQRGLGAQYIIDRNGNIHETGLPSRHMRPGQGVGKGLDNSNTYGVEIIGKDDNDILPIQIEAAKKLREQLGIDPKRVFGHGEVNTHKQATEGQQVVRAIRGMGGETSVAAPKAGTIDIGDKPQLAQLQPKSPFDTKVKATNWTLGQTAPTEQANTMARHPGFEENIKRAMAERGVQVAGFVPPGLTRDAATTRGAANKNVAPKGTIKDAEGEAKRAEELRNVPNAGEQISGGKNLTPEQQAEIAAWNKAHEDWLDGNGPMPGPPPNFKPNARGAGEAAAAAPGRAVIPYDPNVSAQNDPSGRGALISAKIRGTAREGGQPPPRLPPPPGGKQGDLAGPTAAAGAGAVVAGTMAGTQRPEAEKKNTGIPPSLEYLLVSGIPTVKEAMKDPETAGATKKVIQKVISTKARQDAAKADMANDPTFYQRQASKMTNQGGMGDPGSPQYDRMMQDAVARDNAGVMARRGQQPRPQQDPALQAVQQRIQQGPPPEEQPRSRGTISIRPTPDAIRNAPNTPVYPQPGPGQEKGGGPPPEPYPTAPTAGPSPHRFQQYGDAPPSQALPTGYQAPAESVVNHGYNGVPPQMNAQMMDPTMMQLMQFFTQGGGGGGFEGP